MNEIQPTFDINLSSFVTHVDDINQHKQKTTFYIDDESSCRIIMLDMTNKKEIQSTFCFWDKHPFDTYPIGCPIRYVSPVIQKTVYSEITKERYDFRQSITRFHETKSDDIINECGYYEVDGVFCSGNCVLAYIQSQRNNPLYIHSKSLLYKMYLEQTEQTDATLIPAGDWRLLKVFGGFLDIHTFRENFNNFTYEEKMYTINKIPKMNYIGKVYEELPIL